jgi:glycosyltransferase involved in cell wall biosynthesis
VRYLVAIPVFNEAATLRTVLAEVRQYARDILVVDDGSTDDTPRLLAGERGIRRIRHHENCGYGQSLIDAFRYAVEHDYDWLITIDCDEQHEPAAIPEFLRAAAEDDADIISGSRYLTDSPEDPPYRRHPPRPEDPTGKRDSPRPLVRESLLAPPPEHSSARESPAHEPFLSPPPDRRAINQKITDLLNEVLGLKITDAFCGFKAYRVAALRRLNITVPGYGMPIQLWVQAVGEGLRIREIPVRRIYKDPNRFFGGSLDDPDARLLYYCDVLIHELGRLIAKGGPAQQRPEEPCSDCTDG